MGRIISGHDGSFLTRCTGNEGAGERVRGERGSRGTSARGTREQRSSGQEWAARAVRERWGPRETRCGLAQGVEDGMEAARPSNRRNARGSLPRPHQRPLHPTHIPRRTAHGARPLPRPRSPLRLAPLPPPAVAPRAPPRPRVRCVAGGSMDWGCAAPALGCRPWLALALRGLLDAPAVLRSAVARARSPPPFSSYAMAVCASRSPFLLAGALHLSHHWASLSSPFLDPFPDHRSRNLRRQQLSGVIGVTSPLEVNQACQILTNTGAQLLGAGISFYSPWDSIVRFVEGRTKGSRRITVAAAASPGGEDGSSSASSRSTGYGIGSGSRMWTNIILGVNLLVFGAQIASQGQLLLLGAKVNSLIDKGQWWRLVTPSLLHANIMHLLVNCYSINSVGPTVESLSGGKRFLAVYAVSALTSSGLSYTLCTAPSVGASGAIFGLVGALAVFLARHKTLMIGGDRNLAQVGRVIAINLGFGLLSSGIDNWGHVGGLLGGAAVGWLLGPAFTFESAPEVGKNFLLDRPPIAKLLSPWSKQKGDR